MSGAKMASRINSATRIVPAAANLCSKPPNMFRQRRTHLHVLPLLFILKHNHVSRLLIFNSRIDDGVQQINDEVNHDEDEGDHEDARLDNRVVAVADRIINVPADAGPGKIVSVKIAPPSNSPVCRPMTVNTGMNAFLNRAYR